ncbi:DMT family transporter [Planococcus salinus]|uniref:QacE family quaternary ammonium compound efflux SMR transporter n=1 Tax=Planococcus salinus TaxID=1848460 RepID=A0A3M8P5I8_9BACL|nr:multidrug efflux SMR transporter [Planococcus salinus]RNF38560.1 QacE family quaternary ammonium compound efflux SMR transporter [Planococcus salinus]
MAWIYLLVAGLTEIIWAIGLKLAEGFTNFGPSILTVFFIVVTFLLFAKAMVEIPIGTAYAVFTGIGAAGTAILGIILFDENASIEKIAFLCLLIIGIVGLKITDGKESLEKESDV